MKYIVALMTLFCALSAWGQHQVTVFTIGDSTMADRDTAGENQERGWGQMLHCFFTDAVRIENHAVCGRSTKSFLDEGRWQTVMERLQPGDYVVIEFGHNDEKTDPKLYTEPGGTFDENLRRFVNETRAKGGLPILMNSIVRRNYPPTPDTPFEYLPYEQEGDSLVDTHGAYAVVPRQVAEELQVPFVDMTALTRQLVESLGPEQSKALYMWIPAGKYAAHPEGKVDNTHLNIYGSKVVAGIAAAAMVECVPALAPYYVPQEVDAAATDCD